jgi:hypothetical protein
LGKQKTGALYAPLLSFLDEYADWEEREAIQEAIQRIIGTPAHRNFSMERIMKKEMPGTRP